MSAAFLRPCHVLQSNKETFQRNSLELIRSFQNTRENTRFGMKNLKTTTLAVNLPTKDKIDFNLGIGTDRVAFSFDDKIMNETESVSISTKQELKIPHF